jgi:hypothetical protein
MKQSGRQNQVQEHNLTFILRDVYPSTFFQHDVALSQIARE